MNMSSVAVVTRCGEMILKVCATVDVAQSWIKHHPDPEGLIITVYPVEYRMFERSKDLA